MTIDPRTDDLERRIAQLETELGELRKQAVQQQLEQYEARIDDLELQSHLGLMEARDRVAPVVEALRNRWLDATAGITAAPAKAGDVLEELRSGFDKAFHDLSEALTEARGAASR